MVFPIFCASLCAPSLPHIPSSQSLPVSTVRRTTNYPCSCQYTFVFELALPSLSSFPNIPFYILPYLGVDRAVWRPLTSRSDQKYSVFAFLLPRFPLFVIGAGRDKKRIICLIQKTIGKEAGKPTTSHLTPPSAPSAPSNSLTHSPTHSLTLGMAHS